MWVTVCVVSVPAGTIVHYYSLMHATLYISLCIATVPVFILYFVVVVFPNMFLYISF